MSARVLFACWPFEGHVFPQISIALALRARSHDVAFYTGASARDVLESEDFEVFPFRRVEPTWVRVHEREREVGGRGHSLRVLREAREWLVETIPDQVADLEDVIERWRPDVLAAEASMWGPLVLMERLPLPVALASPIVRAQIPGPDAPRLIKVGRPSSAQAKLASALTNRAVDLAARATRRRFDAIRADHGLAPMGCSLNAHCGRLPLYLVHSVPELDHQRRDLPPSVHYVGPCQWHPHEPEGTTQWLDELPAARPWVHVTEGTSHFSQSFILRAAAQGLAGAPVEAILTTGRGRGGLRAGSPSAANVHVTDWLSHDALLPRCAVLVTTGGLGTIMAALTAGVPMVVVPTTWDKPANARWVVDQQLGVRVHPRRCTPERLRAAVLRVLDDPRYRSNAQRAARLLAAAPGPAGAADLLAGLAMPAAADWSTPCA